MSRFYLAIVWLFFAVGLGGGSWASRTAALPQALQLSHQALGFVLLSAALGAVLAFSCSGWLLERVCQAKLTLASMALYCACLSAAGALVNTVATSAALFAVGFGSGLVNVSMNVYAINREQREHITMLASCHGWCSAGALCGAAGGQLAAAGQLALWLHLSAVAVVMALVSAAFAGVVLQLDEVQAKAHAQTASDKTSQATPTRTSLWPLGTLVACAAICEGSYHTWPAVYLHQNLGLSEAEAARGFVIFTLSMVLSRLVVERLAKRLGAARLVLGGSFVMVAGVTLLLCTSSGVVAMVAIGTTGVGLAGAVPLAYREASRRRPQRTQKTLATMTQCTYVGALAAPPLMGVLAEHISLRSALGALGVAAGIIGCMSQTLAEPKPNPANTPR